MKQKERQERSRQEILRAAMEEFGTFGYAKVSVESICTRHSISKGMMYHYYSSKDELFLLCVQETLRGLEDYVKKQIPPLLEQDAAEGILHYFMLRETFFEGEPLGKTVFEDAVFCPSEVLAEEIEALRRPMREMNRQFLRQMLSKAALRPQVEAGTAARYLESLDNLFWSLVAQYQPKERGRDLHAMFAATREILDMVLFGIALQQGPDGQGHEHAVPASREGQGP